MKAKNLRTLQTKVKPKMHKGVFEGLSNAALSLVILVIVVALGALILGGFSNATTDTDALAVISQGQTALATFGNFFNLLVITIVAVAVFILVLAGLARFRGAGSTGF